MLTAIGSFAVRRKYIVLATWIVVILGALPFADRADEFLKPGGFSNESFPSVQARKVLQERLELTTLTIDFVFSHPEWSPFDPRFSAAVESSLEGLTDHSEIVYVTTHLDDPGRASTISNTVHASAGLTIELDASLEFLEIVTAEVDPGPLEMIITGGPALYRDISLASERDLHRGETVAFPIATIVLLLVFGTLVAAILPAAVGGGGVLVGLALVFFMSQGIDMSVFALNIVSLLGIGIGIDYSLFYTSRFQEELRKNKSVDQAVVSAHSHAGKAILFSAVTSLIGLLSLIAFDVMMLRSVGIGAIAVIFAALLAALTLMPAILAILGHRVNRFRIVPRWRSSSSNASGKRISFWLPLSNWVMKRPWLVLVPTSTVLILLAVPALDMKLGTVDATILPDSLESRKGFDVLREEFGFALRTVIPVAYTFGESGTEPGTDLGDENANPFDRENLERAYDIGRELERLEGVTAVTSIVNLDPTFGPDQYELLYQHPEAITDVTAARIVRESVREGAILFLVHSDFHPFYPETRQLVTEIRSLIPPDAPRGGELHVNGGASEITDIVNALYGKFPYIIAAVLGVTYLSLMLLFRSVILPLKAVALNVLSILASYGALVFVFQQGHFSGLLNFEAMGVIEATLPILLFAIIFGLSMDYEIFLLSRVAEAYDRTGDNVASVAEGLQKSGLIITGAASILIVVAASFVLADVVVVKAIGLGLAIAVFVDVTLVRALVAPAIMRIAGPWNWWLPGWLDRLLPEISVKHDS